MASLRAIPSDALKRRGFPVEAEIPVAISRLHCVTLVAAEHDRIALPVRRGGVGIVLARAEARAQSTARKSPNHTPRGG